MKHRYNNSYNNEYDDQQQYIIHTNTNIRTQKHTKLILYTCSNTIYLNPLIYTITVTMNILINTITVTMDTLIHTITVTKEILKYTHCYTKLILYTHRLIHVEYKF